ncbi:hypothetical protein EJ08DRAFT_692051 [Tothia fuscella]|uniref:C2H2-type domain-containing protein n=1 Tax=Tothia fuscella TaxID=1048955 RepID=A0A9P4P2R2_9PEZI|nr:hypothetical protein EJ08DRAFT_692051 [Tothia fuscella]
MPWNIWPALVILWGVCWMFYNPLSYFESEEIPESELGQDVVGLFEGIEWDFGLLDQFDGGELDLNCHVAFPSPFEIHGLEVLEPSNVGSRNGNFNPAALTMAPPSPVEPGTVQPIELERVESMAREQVLRCDRTGCESKTFERQHELTKHMNRHNRPFKCTKVGCRQAFARDSDRQRHEESVHDQDEKAFCTIADCERARRGFARKDHLEQHMRMHAKRKPSRPENDHDESIQPQKRVKISAVQEVDVGGKSEVERLRRMVQELKAENEAMKRECVQKRRLEDENRRLQETVTKQADAICSLVGRKQ